MRSGAPCSWDEDMKANIQEMQDTLVQRAVDIYCQENVLPEEWDLDGRRPTLPGCACPQGVRIVQDGENIDRLTRKDLTKRITDLVHQAYEQREQKIAESNVDMREIERVVLLRCVDDHWMDISMRWISCGKASVYVPMAKGILSWNINLKATICLRT